MWPWKRQKKERRVWGDNLHELYTSDASEIKHFADLILTKTLSFFNTFFQLLHSHIQRTPTEINKLRHQPRLRDAADVYPMSQTRAKLRLELHFYLVTRNYHIEGIERQKKKTDDLHSNFCEQRDESHEISFGCHVNSNVGDEVRIFLH